MVGESAWRSGTGGGSPLDAESIRDAGRWEVVVAGTPPEAVTTEDETDWLYAWMED